LVETVDALRRSLHGNGFQDYLGRPLEALRADILRRARMDLGLIGLGNQATLEVAMLFNLLAENHASTGAEGTLLLFSLWDLIPRVIVHLTAELVCYSRQQLTMAYHTNSSSRKSVEDERSLVPLVKHSGALVDLLETLILKSEDGFKKEVAKSLVSQVLALLLLLDDLMDVDMR
jgi:hypothetical protein